MLESSLVDWSQSVLPDWNVGGVVEEEEEEEKEE